MEACREVLEGLEMGVDVGNWKINEDAGRAQQGIAKQKPELAGGQRKRLVLRSRILVELGHYVVQSQSLFISFSTTINSWPISLYISCTSPNPMRTKY